VPHNQDSSVSELKKLLKRAGQGDHKALPAIRDFFNAAPAMWREYGNLATIAERALVNVAAGENLVLKEAVEKTMDSMRAELAGSHPTPLERLLVDRIVACWLQVHQPFAP
jgi:hypothetical protein